MAGRTPRDLAPWQRPDIAKRPRLGVAKPSFIASTRVTRARGPTLAA